MRGWGTEEIRTYTVKPSAKRASEHPWQIAERRFWPARPRPCALTTALARRNVATLVHGSTPTKRANMASPPYGVGPRLPVPLKSRRARGGARVDTVRHLGERTFNQVVIGTPS